MKKNQAICRECKFKSINRQAGGCLDETEGCCPKCGAYFSFDDIIFVLGRAIPASQVVEIGGEKMAYLTTSDFEQPSSAGQDWGASSEQLDRMIESSNKLLEALRQVKT